MKLVVTGSRHWTNQDQINSVLDGYLQRFMEGRPNYSMEIAHGASKGGGVDLFVAQWCFDNRHRVDEWPFPVRKDLDGNHRGAPLKRNERMLATFFPNLVLGFRSEGKSNGTDHTLHYARRIGIPTEVHNET